MLKLIHSIKTVVLCSLVLTLGLSGSGAAQIAPGVSALLPQLTQQEMLVESVALKEGEIKRAHGAILIQAPVEKSALLFRSPQDYKNIFPYFTESTLLGRVGNQLQLRFAVALAGGFGRLWTEVRHAEDRDAQGNLYFHQRALMGQGSFKRYQFDIRLIQISPEQSLCEIWGLIVPDIPLIPDALTEKVNRDVMRRILKATKNKALGIPFTAHDL